MERDIDLEKHEQNEENRSPEDNSGGRIISELAELNYRITQLKENDPLPLIM